MSEPQPSSAEETQALLARAAGGDSSAWRWIVERWAPRVHALLRAQCRDDELAEEIVQSTFCTLAAKIGSYVESGRFESWIFRIAMNRLRDEMRRRARQARSMEGESLGRIAAPEERSQAPARGASGDATDLREKLEQAIARLSEADREIVELRHTGGLSFQELSDYFEEPIGTLLARHHRALKKLRVLLEAMGVDARDLGGEP